MASIAFNRNYKKSVFTRIIAYYQRFILKNKYWDVTHCELVSKHVGGKYWLCYGASAVDNAVRGKVIRLAGEKQWEVVEYAARGNVTNPPYHLLSKKYDFLGVLAFSGLAKQRSDRFFCSEFVAKVLWSHRRC